MSRYDDLTYERFAELALEKNESTNEKLGFPEQYNREEKRIFEDILAKVPNMARRNNLKVLDIGAGCGPLPSLFSALCRERGHTLFLHDSPQMLDLVPALPHTEKIPGKFPDSLAALREATGGGADIIICYSVFHCGIYNAVNTFDFVDSLMLLLRERGQCIVGDIPNQSKRRRFFASNTGREFHKNFMRTAEEPVVAFNTVEPGSIDENVIQAMVGRCHAGGCDAYIVPQAEGLFFSNRRDDMLIRKP